jgi:hypothetical protein
MDLALPIVEQAALYYQNQSAIKIGIIKHWSMRSLVMTKVLLSSVVLIQLFDQMVGWPS